MREHDPGGILEELIGSLTITTTPESATDKAALIDEINRAVRPPRPVTLDSVYFGVLQAASNRVNMQGGCFEVAELQQLARLIVDTPVMVGHKKQELPIGRVFKGEVVEEQGAPWLRAYFYWHRDQANADALKVNIDAGIYKECSLGFLYGKPECGVCRADMRLCRHRLNEVVRLGGRDIKAFYYYKQIKKVLEVSLVYRGAVEGTKVTSLTLSVSKPDDTPSSIDSRLSPEVAFDLAQIAEPLDEVMIEPLYRGVWLTITCTNGEVNAVTQDGQAYRHAVLDELRRCTASDNYQISAQLIPVKGGSRLPLQSLCEPRADAGLPRCRLTLVDIVSLDGVDLRYESARSRKAKLCQAFKRFPAIAPIPHYCCRFIELKDKTGAKGSSEGLRVIDLGVETAERTFEIRRKGLVKGVVGLRAFPDGKQTCTIRFGDDASRCHSLNTGGRSLMEGAMVWATPVAQRSFGFDFVDCCIGENRTDAPSVIDKLPVENTVDTFAQYCDSDGDCWIDLRLHQTRLLLRVARLNLPLLERGRRFWCGVGHKSHAAFRPAGRVRLVDQGRVSSFTKADDGRVALGLEGNTLKGNYVVEPTRFGKEERCLLFKEIVHE
jgi:hypothetical protein